MPIETIVPESDKSLYNNFHFAPAVRTNGMVICSGVIGTGADGKVPEAAADEFRLAWQGVGQVLKEAGLGYENIVDCTTYHVGLNDHLGDFMKVRDEFLAEPWPAWTAIGVTELAVRGGRVEIRVVAV